MTDNLSRRVRPHIVIGGSVAIAVVLASVAAVMWVLFPRTAELGAGQLALNIDRNLVTPIGVTRRFPRDARAVYVTATVSNAPLGTKVRATLYEAATDRSSGTFEVVAVGTRNVGFEFTPGARGWSPGRYEIRLFLNGTEKERLPFDVVGEAADLGIVSNPSRAGFRSQSVRAP